MKSGRIKVFYSEEDEGYIANIPDLPGCSAFGDTPEETLKEAGEAKKIWLEVSLRRWNRMG